MASTQKQVPRAPSSVTHGKTGGVNPGGISHGVLRQPSPGCTLQASDLVFPFSVGARANPTPFRSTEKASGPPGARTRGREDAGLEHPPPLVSRDKVFLRQPPLYLGCSDFASRRPVTQAGLAGRRSTVQPCVAIGRAGGGGGVEAGQAVSGCEKQGSV